MTDTWKRTTALPPGLQHFVRWFRPEGVPSNFRPADIDGIWHDKRENRFLMFEFKPDGTEDIPYGQRITLEGFSKLPGCTSLLILDQRWDDTTGEPVPDEEAVTIRVWIDGEVKVHTIDFKRLNLGLSLWYRNEGPLVKHTVEEVHIPPVVYNPAPWEPGPRTREEMFKNLPE